VGDIRESSSQLADDLVSAGVAVQDLIQVDGDSVSFGYEDARIVVSAAELAKDLTVVLSMNVAGHAFERTAVLSDVEAVASYLSDQFDEPVCSECAKTIDDNTNRWPRAEFPGLCEPCYVERRTQELAKCVPVPSEFLHVAISVSELKVWRRIGLDLDELIYIGKEIGFDNPVMVREAVSQGVPIDEDFFECASNVTDEEWLKWQDAGFSMEQFVQFQPTGWLPDFAYPFLERGLTAEQTERISDIAWLRLDAAVLSELLSDPSFQFKNDCLAELEQAGVPLTADGIRQWSGLLADEILEAVALGLPDAAHAQRYLDLDMSLWTQHGFTLEVAERIGDSDWLRVDRAVLSELLNDPSFEFDEVCLQDLQRAGVPSTVAGIRRWSLLEDEILEAVALALPDAASAQRYLDLDMSLWTQHGFTLEVAARIGDSDWLRVDRAVLSELLNDPSFEFDEVRLQDLQRAGVPLTVAGIRRWGGLNADQILQAVDLGFPDAASAIGWKAFAPSEVQAWIDAGFDARDAEKWKAFAPSEVQAWIDAGFDVRDAEKWKQSGADPATAARRAAAGLVPPTLI